MLYGNGYDRVITSVDKSINPFCSMSRVSPQQLNNQQPCVCISQLAVWSGERECR